MSQHKHSIGDQGVVIKGGVPQPWGTVRVTRLDRNHTYRVQESAHDTFVTVHEDEFVATHLADGTVLGSPAALITERLAALEARIVDLVAASTRKYGHEHTHDVACRTWRGQNWGGACNCTLPARAPMIEKVAA